MRHWNAPSTRPLERGRASIEFLVFAIVLFVPLVFAISSLWGIQAAAIATEQAARDAVRVFIQHQNLSQASGNSEAIARRVLVEHGVSGAWRMERSCRPAVCLAPGALVHIVVTTEVVLWRAPGLGDSWPLSVPVRGSASARVSTYGGIG
jgi:Flp pilus assembly protein TadG